MGAGIGAPGESGRVFVPNRLPRKGLQTGDVVALALANTGELLAAAKVRNTTVDEEDGNSAQRQYTLIPMGKATLDDEVVLLEVVRNGQWTGFKSWVADNALLQAKKKGTYRLAFFSTRFGVYEQWECGEKGEEGDRLPMDGIHWASTVVTLRNRKVPSVVLKVELHRAGLCHYTSVRGTKESGDAVTAPVVMPSISNHVGPCAPPFGATASRHGNHCQCLYYHADDPYHVQHDGARVDHVCGEGEIPSGTAAGQGGPGDGGRGGAPSMGSYADSMRTAGRARGD